MFITTFCLNVLKFNRDEDKVIDALRASVNFHCLVLPLLMLCDGDHNIIYHMKIS